MYKKFVASFMTALMAVTMLVSPALGATALNTYPSFLGKVGSFYVVVGSSAAASDIAGAIDIAANLAQLSYTPTAVSTGTTTSAAGSLERKIAIPSAACCTNQGAIAGTGSNNVPSTLRQFHFSGLQSGSYNYLTTTHNFHEEVRPGTPTNSSFVITHSLTSPINGTLRMKIDTSGVEYRYVFDDTVAAADFSYTASNSSTYTNPLTLTVSGQPFLITAIPTTTSFKALVGNVGWVTQGSTKGVAVGNLTALVDTVYSGTQAAVRIVDQNGNTVQNLGVVGTTTQSFSYGGNTYNIKVLQTATVSVAGAGTNQAQLLFGQGNVETTFDASTTATLNQWGANWVIGGSFATAGQVTSGDYVFVRYVPSSLADEQRYFPSPLAGTTTFNGPGNYFQLWYNGLYPGKFATITLVDSGTVTIYNTTAATGYGTVGNLRGIMVTSDTAGTLINASTGYSTFYVLFNGSQAATSFNGTAVYHAYKDPTTNRIVNINPAVYPQNISANLTNGGTQGNVNFTLSYGGPGATAQYNLNFTVSDTRLLSNVTLDNNAGTITGAFNFTNYTTASTTTGPQVQLGASPSAVDTNDQRAQVEGSLQDISAQAGTIMSDNGVQVKAVQSNTLNNQVVLGVPPETVYALIDFGKQAGTTTTTTTGTTVNAVVPVTVPVAKLDSEVTSTDLSTKAFVLVGGPCANSLVAQLNTATKFAYSCSSWPARNFGLIQVVDNAFTTGGSQAVVVAGTRAADTRLASSVLQNGGLLSTTNSSKVEVAGSSLATATVTPVS